MAKPKVFIVGVGMTEFEKPGRNHSQMAVESVTKALEDAKINVQEIDQAVVGYTKRDSMPTNETLDEIGITEIPIHNIEGILALWKGKKIIESQNADCVLVFGSEYIKCGPLSAKFSGQDKVTKLYGKDVLDYLIKNCPELAAKLASGNKKYSPNTTRMKIQLNICQPIRTMHDEGSGPLRIIEFDPKSDNFAAVILASEQFVVKNNLQDQAVEIIGMERASFSNQAFDQVAVYGTTKVAADKLFLDTTILPNDVDIVELQVVGDFSDDKIEICEALNLCKPEKKAQLVINPSGRILPIDPTSDVTGISLCSELYWQLLGKSDNKQVPAAKIALQQSIGFSEVILTLYKQGFPKSSFTTKQKLVEPKTDKNATAFIVYKIFKILEEAMLNDKINLIKGQDISYCFKVTNINGQEGMWIVDTKKKNRSVTFNGTGKSDVIIIMKDNDAYELLSGSMLPQEAILQGKIKVQGDTVAAQKLVGLEDLVSGIVAVLKSKL